MNDLSSLRKKIQLLETANESALLADLQDRAEISAAQRGDASKLGEDIVKDIRSDDELGLMEIFLSEYGLSTDEGVALMCMAEALLRVPDTETMDELIADKIVPSSWGEHLGSSASPLVNASTWALMLTGKVLETDRGSSMAHILQNAIKRLGEPVIRVAVKRAMQEMGKQFVLGESIEHAIKNGGPSRQRGFTYSYDMLGEAAVTGADARRYYETYRSAISRIRDNANGDNIQDNPGISIKLSALHPRYELSQKTRIMSELTERLLQLCLDARAANIGLNIDAEEAERLDLSLDTINAILPDSRLQGWSGFGVVVQAYGKRASAVIDWLYTLAIHLDRKIMVRLVKGAYWDTEIKRAQVEGLDTYPVFTRKSATDVSYICCAKQLLSLTDRIYPQFATHNAHSVASILSFGADKSTYEFQRLHGMGSVLHRQIMERHKTRCRIYAPVGEHKDLLAYLVRRLLENGANSSFVNQIVDETIDPKDIAADPFKSLKTDIRKGRPALPSPENIYAPHRKNSKGWDVHSYRDLSGIERARAPFKDKRWTITSIISGKTKGISGKTKGAAIEPILNPADPNDQLGTVVQAAPEDIALAIQNARPWSSMTASQRAATLNHAADLYEENFGEIFTVLTREAGKTIPDAIAELREAVDFLRYYAHQSISVATESDRAPRGLISCISPWNFPLAIFTGQVAAALAAGNGVLAKPAESTPIIAALAVKYLHKAGVPKPCLQLLTGRGQVTGAALVSHPAINGVCFTGSTRTAQIIHKTMAKSLEPAAPLIAETGGLNAMIVDSTALPEQAVKDIIASAFQSAGQRCSALRLLYIQSDIAAPFLKMLKGAMDELKIGNPWNLNTDIGPIIHRDAQKEINDYITQARSDGRVMKSLVPPLNGNFIGPTIISVKGIEDLDTEVFGPVLHIATFEADELPKIIADINASGYGLTFGLHTRIDSRVEYVTQNLNVGNIYVNRNQIGAVVGSQPFGGEALSGTGPKAGGPNYVRRFSVSTDPLSIVKHTPLKIKTYLPRQAVQSYLSQAPKPLRHALRTHEMPGPTGESNRLSEYPRGTILCLGPNPECAEKQVAIAKGRGCSAVAIYEGAKGESSLNGVINPDDLIELNGFHGVAYWGTDDFARDIRQALAQREGPTLTLMGPNDMEICCTVERHVCVDTTAAGGNVALLSGISAARDASG